MFSNTLTVMTILSVFFIWISCSMVEPLTKDYFNRENWFQHGNIFHIEQDRFRMNFQQHRNVNRHLNWLTDEISLINRQIQSIREHAVFVLHSYDNDKSSFQQTEYSTQSISNSSKNTSKKSSYNHRNIVILKSLSNETLFHRYWKELVIIYQFSPITTIIECIAVIKEQNFIGKHLLIKLSDGYIDKYQINGSRSLRETLFRINQPIFVWNNDGRQLEYYRRFISNYKNNEIILTDHLASIKNRPKTTDVNFFDMMGPILRVKYRIDPSSLSCILEIFFGDIYTCDGRLIYPYELKLLFDDHSFFVFYAIMMDTRTERQIFPLDNTNYVRSGDQIYFLFQTHPQYQSLSSYSCPDCPRNDRTYVLNSNPQPIESKTDNSISESPASSTEQLIRIPLPNIPQNYIVYFVVGTIVLYIVIGICFTRRQDQSIECSQRKLSISSRRGR